MAAKLAAGRFPSAERLRGTGEAGVQAKRVQEPIRRNAHQERAIVVRGLLARAGQEAHLRHGERRSAQFGVFPREDQGLGERQRLDRLRPAGGSGRSRRCCRLLRESCGRTRDCGCKEPPTPFVLVVHIWILQQRFSHGSLKPVRPSARMPPRSAAADLGTLANSLLLVGRSARAPAFTPRTPQIMTERTAIITPRMNLRLRRLFITVAGELSVRRAATLVHSSLNGITKSRRSRRRLPPNGSHARQ